MNGALYVFLEWDLYIHLNDVTLHVV